MKRAYLKARLPANEDYYAALGILKAWALARETARHFAKAIRLYDSLLKGDFSLLVELFPKVVWMQGGPAVSAPVKLSSPLLAIETEREENEELNEALELLGDLF